MSDRELAAELHDLVAAYFAALVRLDRIEGLARAVEPDEVNPTARAASELRRQHFVQDTKTWNEMRAEFPATFALLSAIPRSAVGGGT